MNKESRSRIFDEAVRIGEELLASAKTDKNGMSWKTMSIDYEKERSDPDYISWHEAEGIYTGVSGISLFFLELFKQNKNKKYLKAATEGMRWVVNQCRENPSEYYAFFTGRMGVPYVLLKLYEFTGDKDYLKKALEIAEPCEKFLESPMVVDDLINGTSGTLLGLLHLHAATGEKSLLDKADSFLRHLIDNAHRGPEGLYWDYSPKHIRGLCGFSHGAAGIGYVFLEAGRYLGNPALYQVAEEAFRYERYFFSEENYNWPDFRKGIWEPTDYADHKEAYLNGNTAFFSEPKYMNAWCHGAAGIGLARLRAYEILGDDLYSQEARIAALKTRATDILPEDITDDRMKLRSYTLCHGGGGNAEIFLEAYRVFGEEDYLAMAEKVADQAIEIKSIASYLSGFSFAGGLEDTSLFMGNAGIGYFYLKLLEPSKVPSILMPRVLSGPIDKQDLPEGSLLKSDRKEIRKRIIRKAFQRTGHLVDELLADATDKYFEQHSPNGICEEESFTNYIKNTVIPSLTGKDQALLEDVFTLESEKFYLAQAIDSSSFLNIRQVLHSERTAELLKDSDEEDLMQLALKLNPDVHIYYAGWNWNGESVADWSANLKAEKDNFPVLLKTDAHEKIIENHLSPFSYAVLEVFREAKPVQDAVLEITASFDSVNDAQKAQIKSSIIEQVQQALFAGFLITGED